jgi:HPt (histidine-containing phosphotransfer) domain-containing protein
VKNSTEHKTFIFNDKIDKDLLNSLYEDDFPYMEEIFSITLTQLKPDLVILKTAYEKGDWSGLQKAVHKIKPSFGFVGLPQTQQLCKQFEDSCANPDFAGQSASQYNSLCTELEESIHIIETEQARLKEYNLAG